ncbi:MAG: SIS domain-containing protein [Selenomonadaceae bacterium]|nr:SIS domain-containing protein [Selenomonadaceae bacterium]
MEFVNFKIDYENNVRMVLNEIETGLFAIDQKETARLIEDICSADQVFLMGVGRVMLSLQAFCKRLTHLGIKAHCVGDITEPALSPKDLLVVASGSGESIIVVAIAKKAKELGATVAHIGSNTESSMRKYSDYMVRVPVRTRLNKADELKSEQIMTSLFEQIILIFGDVVSLLIVKDKKLDLNKLWKCHANLE